MTAEVDDEISLHLESRRDQLIALGTPPEDAAREAERQFGSLGGARRLLQVAAGRRERRLKLRERADAVMLDGHDALRGLWRAPRFAMFIIAVLALGIGANAAMFGVADRLLLRGPEHVVEPNELVRLYRTGWPAKSDAASSALPYAGYDVIRRNTHSFSSVAAYSFLAVSIGPVTEPHQVPAGYVTASFFPLLGVKPVLGRFFTDTEDNAYAPEPVAVLGYGLWLREFGGDRQVLGRQITIRKTPYVVIGVAPAGFTGAELAPVDLWMPIGIMGGMGRPSSWPTSWQSDWLNIIARLKPGTTLQLANSDVTATYRNGYAGPDRTMKAARLTAAPLSFNHDGKEPTELTVSRWLIGVAAIVLLIACANASNLLLARTVLRRGEISVRIALGAGRSRVVRLVLFEGIALALTAGVAALAVARGAGQLIHRVLLPGIEWSDSVLSPRMILYCTAVAIVTGVIMALIPALSTSRLDLVTSLKVARRSAGGRRAPLSAALTVLQVALSAVLLIGAALFILSLWKIYTMDIGAEPSHVIAVTFNWPNVDMPRASAEALTAQRYAIVGEAVQRVRRLPGVEQASASIGLPLGNYFSVSVRVPATDSYPPLDATTPTVSAVADGYFATVGTRILRGRPFTAADRSGSERVVIVSARMAATFWPGRNPLGDCLIISELPCARVVGVAADVRRHELHEAPTQHYYVPLGQEPDISPPEMLARSAGNPLGLLRDIRQAMLATDPTLRFSAYDGTTMERAIDAQARPWRLGAIVFGLFGVLALLVAAIGLYSLIAYQVAERTHELGVRIALGAQSGRLVGLVMRQTMILVGLGGAIGLVIAWCAGRFLGPLLFETSPHSAVAFTVSIGVLLVAAAAAGWIPARRVTLISPTESLRAR